MNGDLVAGAGGVHDGGHAVGEQVEAAPGELDAGEGEHPGELARHVHLEATVHVLLLSKGTFGWTSARSERRDENVKSNIFYRRIHKTL